MPYGLTFPTPGRRGGGLPDPWGRPAPAPSPNAPYDPTRPGGGVVTRREVRQSRVPGQPPEIIETPIPSEPYPQQPVEGLRRAAEPPIYGRERMDYNAQRQREVQEGYNRDEQVRNETRWQNEAAARTERQAALEEEMARLRIRGAQDVVTGRAGGGEDGGGGGGGGGGGTTPLPPGPGPITLPPRPLGIDRASLAGPAGVPQGDEPLPPDPALREAASSAAYGRARERIGQSTQGALRGLTQAMESRGIGGSEIEARGMGGVVERGLGELGEVERMSALEALRRAEEEEDRDLRLGLARRGQDVGMRGQDIEALMGGRGQDISVRGQDISALLAREAARSGASRSNLGALIGLIGGGRLF